MKPLQNCKLCLQPRELCKSHAIPDEFFKLIFRKYSGKAILLPEGNKKIRNSQDSGAVHLLCRECEALFNERYDRDSIALIKSLSHDFVKNNDITKIETSANTLRLFCLSILWRASISHAESYKLFKLGDHFNEVLRAIFINKNNFEKTYSVRMARLVDPSKNGFSKSNMDGLLILPFQSSSDGKAAVFKFVVLGFIFEIYFGTPSRKTQGKLGFTYKNKSTIFIPSEDIFSHHDLISHLARAKEKHLSGNTLLPC